MEIKLDAEAAQEIATAAIINNIGPEQKDQILQQAVKALLEPTQKGYYNGKTPLQQAFDAAVSQAAYRAVSEAIAEDPRIAEAINDLMGPIVNGALAEMVSKGDFSLSEKIGEALGSWIQEQASSRRD